MRAWEQREADLTALGGRLLVLSGDEREVLAAAVDKRGFGELAIAPAAPADWAALDVQNERRESLPHPTTLVLSASGEVLLREVHTNFRERSDPGRALMALRGHLDESGEGAGASGAAEIDWENAARASVTREGDVIRFQLDIEPGFHAYGRKEEIGVPVYLRVTDGPRAKVPKGHKVKASYGKSWVLDGRVVLEVEVPPGPATGQVGWQLCTESACSAPRNRPFEL